MISLHRNQGKKRYTAIHIFHYTAIHTFPEIRKFKNLTLKIQGQGHGYGQRSRSHRVSIILSIHIHFKSNGPSFSWNTVSVFYFGASYLLLFDLFLFFFFLKFFLLLLPFLLIFCTARNRKMIGKFTTWGLFYWYGIGLTQWDMGDLNQF